MARFCGDGGAPAALRLIMMLRVWRRRRWVDDNILYWLVMRLVAFFCCFPFLQQPEKLRGERERAYLVGLSILGTLRMGRPTNLMKDPRPRYR